MDPITRRAFLKVTGFAGLALLAACRAEGSPAGEGASAALNGASLLSPSPVELLITPTGELYTQSYSSTPRVDPGTWRLSVDGLVDRPLTLTYAELSSFAKVESLRTLECIGNPVGGSLASSSPPMSASAIGRAAAGRTRPRSKRTPSCASRGASAPCLSGECPSSGWPSPG